MTDRGGLPITVYGRNFDSLYGRPVVGLPLSQYPRVEILFDYPLGYDDREFDEVS